MVVKGNVLHFQMEDRIYIEISNTNVITKKKKKRDGYGRGIHNLRRRLVTYERFPYMCPPPNQKPLVRPR